MARVGLKKAIREDGAEGRRPAGAPSASGSGAVRGAPSPRRPRRRSASLRAGERIGLPTGTRSEAQTRQVPGRDLRRGLAILSPARRSGRVRPTPRARGFRGEGESCAGGGSPRTTCTECAEGRLRGAQMGQGQRRNEGVWAQVMQTVS
jgi:hypothetical protein